MAEPYVIKMPQLSDTMTEGVVVSWEKAVGDKIARGDIVATVETDKAIMDVEVFREGYLSGPLAPVDSTVAVGDAMAYLVASADEVDTGEAAPAAAQRAVAAPEAAAETPGPAEAEAAGTAEESAAPEGASHTITMPQLS
ncbi:MAG: pyruvate dehydrogenase, partial [Gammaproteobacteria bacterium]